MILLLFVASAALVPAAQEPTVYARAKTLIREGQFDQGIALLRPLLESDPLNLRALNLLGIALTGKGDLAAGNREFVRALKIDPQFHPALKNLAVNEFTLKDFTASERHFTHALKLVPADPAIHAYLGRIAFERQDFVLASNHLAKAGRLLAQDPTLAAELIQSYLETGKGEDALASLGKAELRHAPVGLQFRLAVALAQHHYFEEAVPLFRVVQAKDPDSYDAGFNLAVCYVQTGRFRDAVDLLRGLKNRGHRTAELNNLLAQAFEGNQQTQEAIDVLREATLIAPENEDNYLDLAALCIDHEAYNLGLEVLEVGLHYRPQSDRLILQRAILYAMRGQLDRAEESFQLASRLAPEKSLAYAGLGITYMQTGDLQEAIRTLRERAKEKPDDHLLQYLLGKALMRPGATQGTPDFTEARTALERSVELNGRFAPSRAELGKLYLTENHVDQAVQMLEEALSMDPTDGPTCVQLGIAYVRQGKREKAAAMASTLARLNEEEWARELHRRLRLLKRDSSPNN